MRKGIETLAGCLAVIVVLLATALPVSGQDVAGRVYSKLLHVEAVLSEMAERLPQSDADSQRAFRSWKKGPSSGGALTFDHERSSWRVDGGFMERVRAFRRDVQVLHDYGGKGAYGPVLYLIGLGKVDQDFAADRKDPTLEVFLRNLKAFRHEVSISLVRIQEQRSELESAIPDAKRIREQFRSRLAQAKGKVALERTLLGMGMEDLKVPERRASPGVTTDPLMDRLRSKIARETNTKRRVALLEALTALNIGGEKAAMKAELILYRAGVNTQTVEKLFRPGGKARVIWRVQISAKKAARKP